MESLDSSGDEESVAVDGGVSGGMFGATMNSGSKPRLLEVGSKVLYRNPGLNSKLQEAWDGPYVVLEK